ncbi:MAG TPA: alpha/beta hydrolase, partial [Pseudonocardiaceae bacterium]|nr:alpha/beta hydrolase [Pseudonocardiaceae bacterium]
MRGRTVALFGGLAGVAVAGLAAGVLRGRARRRSRITLTELSAEDEFGELPAERGLQIVTGDGVRLWVEQTGPGALTVVFCHGFVLDRRMWYFQRRDLPKLLDEQVAMVCYDHRSHGLSARSSRHASTIDQLGRDLAAVLAETAPQGPVVLVGHSMGAMTIMALAEQRPELFADRVVGVALLCTSAGDLGRLALAKPFLSERSVLTAFGSIAAARRADVVEWGRRLTSSAAKPVVRRLAFGSGPVASVVVDLVDRMIAATPLQVMTDFARTLGEHD